MDAYRLVPMKPDQAEACVVVFYHPQWGMPAFQLYYGMLFGLPLAVTSFNRNSRFCEAAAWAPFSRCILMMAPFRTGLPPTFCTTGCFPVHAPSRDTVGRGEIATFCDLRGFLGFGP